MIAIVRFEVGPQEAPTFVARAQRAVAVMEQQAGFRSADLGQNLDEPRLWTLTTRWADVGSYRRALQGYEAKMAVVPVLSQAVDEPSAYEDPDELDSVVGPARGEPSRPGPLR